MPRQVCVLNLDELTDMSSSLFTFLSSSAAYEPKTKSMGAKISGLAAEDAFINTTIPSLNLDILFLNTKHEDFNECLRRAPILSERLKAADIFLITATIPSRSQENIELWCQSQIGIALRWLMEVQGRKRLENFWSKPKILVLTKNDPSIPDVKALAIVEQCATLTRAHFAEHPQDQQLDHVLLVSSTLPNNLTQLMQLCQQDSPRSCLPHTNIFGKIHLYLAKILVEKDEAGQLEHFCSLITSLCKADERLITILHEKLENASRSFPSNWLGQLNSYVQYLRDLRTQMSSQTEEIFQETFFKYRVFLIHECVPLEVASRAPLSVEIQQQINSLKEHLKQMCSSARSTGHRTAPAPVRPADLSSLSLGACSAAQPVRLRSASPLSLGACSAVQPSPLRNASPLSLSAYPSAQPLPLRSASPPHCISVSAISTSAALPAKKICILNINTGEPESTLFDIIQQSYALNHLVASNPKDDNCFFSTMLANLILQSIRVHHRNYLSLCRSIVYTTSDVFMVTITLTHEFASQSIQAILRSTFERMEHASSMDKKFALKPTFLVLAGSPSLSYKDALTILQNFQSQWHAIKTQNPFAQLLKEIILVSSAEPNSTEAFVTLCQQAQTQSQLSDSNIFGQIHIYLAEKLSNQANEGQLEHFCALIKGLSEAFTFPDPHMALPLSLKTSVDQAKQQFNPGFFAGKHRYREYMITLSGMYMDTVKRTFDEYKNFLIVDTLLLNIPHDTPCFSRTSQEIIPLKIYLRTYIIERTRSASAMAATAGPSLSNPDQSTAMAPAQDPVASCSSSSSSETSTPLPPAPIAAGPVLPVPALPANPARPHHKPPMLSRVDLFNLGNNDDEHL